MFAFARPTARFAVAAASVATLMVAAPQASAAEETVGAVQIAPEASQETRDFVAANRAEAAAAANVCGSGYSVSKATPLPQGTDPRERLATLFTYVGQAGGCAILDNNTGRAHSMTLQVCDGYPGTRCDSDSGTFSQYAGPVYTRHQICATVTAKLSTFVNYRSQYAFSCN